MQEIFLLKTLSFKFITKSDIWKKVTNPTSNFSRKFFKYIKIDHQKKLGTKREPKNLLFLVLQLTKMFYSNH